MVDFTNAILIEVPNHASGIQTFRCGGTNDLKPGWACTGMGQPAGTVSQLTGEDWCAAGIVLDDPGRDMDEYFENGEEVSVAMRASGALVWAYYHGGAIRYPGVEYRAMTGEGGAVGEASGSTLFIGTGVEHSSASAGYYRPIKLRLN